MGNSDTILLLDRQVAAETLQGLPNRPGLEDRIIPVTYSRIIARELGLREKDLGDLLWGTGVDSDSLNQDTFLLNARQQLQINSNAIKLLGDFCFGLRMGRLMTPASHGPLGFLIQSCPDLKSAIDAFRSFFSSRMWFGRIECVRRDPWLECRFCIDLPPEHDLNYMYEIFSQVLLSVVESVLGRSLTEGRMYFHYPQPCYSRAYSQYISCPITFSASESKLLIPLDLCDAVNAGSNRDLYDFALRQCRAMLQKLSGDKRTTTTRLRALLLSHPTVKLTEDEAAANMLISKRTLARRLTQEGSSFRQVRDEVLLTLAARYLRETDVSVDAIAALLEYHDCANFRRAFKRCCQITPQAYRQEAKSASGAHTV